MPSSPILTSFATLDKTSGNSPGHLQLAEWHWTYTSRCSELRKKSSALILRSGELLHLYVMRANIYAKKRPSMKSHSPTYRIKSSYVTMSGGASTEHICVVSGILECRRGSVVRYVLVLTLML